MMAKLARYAHTDHASSYDKDGYILALVETKMVGSAQIRHRCRCDVRGVSVEIQTVRVGRKGRREMRNDCHVCAAAMCEREFTGSFMVWALSMLPSCL